MTALARGGGGGVVCCLLAYLLAVRPSNMLVYLRADLLRHIYVLPH